MEAHQIDLYFLNGIRETFCFVKNIEVNQEAEYPSQIKIQSRRTRVNKKIPRVVPWFKALPKVRIVCIIWRNFPDYFTTLTSIKLTNKQRLNIKSQRPFISELFQNSMEYTTTVFIINYSLRGISYGLDNALDLRS